MALALALTLAPALADAPSASETRPIDPARSQVEFSVRKLWFVRVRGTFPRLSGTFRRIDTPGGADLGEVDADLAVASLVMDDAGDRGHALGSGFFDAAEYPDVRFASDPFPLEELVSGGVLRGMLDLRGERHPVRFAILPSDCPRAPLDCVIRVRGTISRSAFGMHGWRGVLLDKVELDLRITLGAPAPPP